MLDFNGFVSLFSFLLAKSRRVFKAELRGNVLWENSPRKLDPTQVLLCLKPVREPSPDCLTLYKQQTDQELKLRFLPSTLHPWHLQWIIIFSSFSHHVLPSTYDSLTLPSPYQNIAAEIILPLHPAFCIPTRNSSFCIYSSCSWTNTSRIKWMKIPAGRK